MSSADKTKVAPERQREYWRTAWAKRMANIGDKKEFNRVRAEKNKKRKTSEEWKEYNHAQYLKRRKAKIEAAKKYRQNHRDDWRVYEREYSKRKYAKKVALWRVDAEAYAKHREDVRIKKALKNVRAGKVYRPQMTARIPDYMVRDAPFRPAENFVIPNSSFSKEEGTYVMVGTSLRWKSI